MKWNNVAKPFKKLLVSQGGSTAGRNNHGRITSFHRGGGAKRLHRKIDLKRSTSSMGIVERIEYDPNRSSRVALVRWIEGVQPGTQKICEKDFTPPQKVTEPMAIPVVGQFPLGCFTPGLMASNMTSHKETPTKLNCVRDVFVSAFSSHKAKGESLGIIPRIAVAGAKPAVFAPQVREQVREGERMFSLSDVQRWRKDSVLWEHRLKRKAAVSWSSFVRDEPVGPARASVSNETKSVGKWSKTGVADRAPLTYIIASNEMKEGTMVMNCDPSDRPTRSF